MYKRQELDNVLAWLPIEETTINIKELWWNPEYRLIAILLNCVMAVSYTHLEY